MAKRRHTTEQIIRKLREAEVGLAKGQAIKAVCKKLEITEQTYYRWRKEYGGLRMDQAKRFKQLDRAYRPLVATSSICPVGLCSETGPVPGL